MPQRILGAWCSRPYLSGVSVPQRIIGAWCSRPCLSASADPRCLVQPAGMLLPVLLMGCVLFGPARCDPSLTAAAAGTSGGPSSPDPPATSDSTDSGASLPTAGPGVTAGLDPAIAGLMDFFRGASTRLTTKEPLVKPGTKVVIDIQRGFAAIYELQMKLLKTHNRMESRLHSIEQQQAKEADRLDSVEEAMNINYFRLKDAEQAQRALDARVKAAEQWPQRSDPAAAPDGHVSGADSDSSATGERPHQPPIQSSDIDASGKRWQDAQSGKAPTTA